MASRSLGTLTVDLVAKVGGFQTGMTKAEREADKRAAAIERRLKKMGTAIDAAFKIAAAAAVAAFAGISIGVGRAINGMDQLAKSAQKVGVGTEALSKLAYAAQLSDVSFEQLEGALAKLAKTQDMAAQGSKEQIEVFRALGVEFKRADGTLRSTDEVLADIADRFQSLPDGSTKTAAAMALLGRSGAQLIPLLNGGSQGLAEMGDELERLGGVVTPEAAKQAEQFNDNITRLKTAVDGLWISVASDLLPDLVRLSESMAEGAKNGGGLRETMTNLTDSAKVFADTLFRAFKYLELIINNRVAFTSNAINVATTNPLSPLTTIDNFLFDGAIGRASGDLAATSRARELEASRGADEGLGIGRGVYTDPVQDAKDAEARAEAERKVADALEEQRMAQERAAAARQAAAEAARAQAAADREAEAQAKAFEATQTALAGILRKQAEEMGGPLAQAAFQYQDTMVQLAAAEEELIRLGKLDEEQTNRLALARSQANAEYQKTVEAIQAQVDPLEGLLGAMDMELSMLRQTNAERVTEAELQRLILEYRRQGIELSAEEVESARARIQSKVEEIEALDKQISALDRFRSSFADNVADVLTGSKSIKEALLDLVDSFIEQLARMAAQNLSASFLGQQGTAGGGTWGDALGAFFGMFGGARADGGPVSPGKAYLVGEEGPELFRPRGAGQIVPADQTARMGRGMTIGGDTIVIQGATTRASLQHMELRKARRLRKFEREFS